MLGLSFDSFLSLRACMFVTRCPMVYAVREHINLWYQVFTNFASLGLSCTVWLSLWVRNDVDG